MRYPFKRGGCGHGGNGCSPAQVAEAEGGDRRASAWSTSSRKCSGRRRSHRARSLAILSGWPARLARLQPGRVQGLGHQPTTTTPAATRSPRPRTARGTSRTQWDPNAPLPILATEYDSAWTVKQSYRYDPLGQPAATKTGSGSLFYYHHDTQGSPVDVAGSTGTLHQRWAYDPFGTRVLNTTTSGAPASTPSYTGARNETTTGNLDLHARQYNTTTGRFNRPDPITPSVGSPYVSAYAYADNQPTHLTDPSGLTPGDPDDERVDSLGEALSIFGNAFVDVFKSPFVFLGDVHDVVHRRERRRRGLRRQVPPGPTGLPPLPGRVHVPPAGLRRARRPLRRSSGRTHPATRHHGHQRPVRLAAYGGQPQRGRSGKRGQCRHGSCTGRGRARVCPASQVSPSVAVRR
ncbi:RHS repeat-associated core domain-containing protein [Streptomyces griseosporeus]